MPLFMFISGYFSTSEATVSTQEAIGRIKRRTVTYFLPFLSWFFIVKTLIQGAYGRNVFVAAQALVNDVQASFWFLWALLVLSVIFILGDVICTKAKSKLAQLILLGTSAAVFMIPWAVIYLKVSGFFLGSKYIMYYSIFFGVGFLVRKYKLHSIILKKPVIKDLCFLACLLIFAAIVLNNYLYTEQNGIRNVILRTIAAYTGIVVIGILCAKVPARKQKKARKFYHGSVAIRWESMLCI